MSALKLYTDGSCKGNPGPGGWGVFLVYPDGTESEFYGGEESTTNNRMELMAAVKAVQLLANKWGSAVITTDSTYVQNGITSWIKSWVKNSWRTANGSPVKNKDLWQALQKAISETKVAITWEWTKSHVGTYGNEDADRLSNIFPDEFLAKNKLKSVAASPDMGSGDLFATPEAPAPAAEKPVVSKKLMTKEALLALIDSIPEELLVVSMEVVSCKGVACSVVGTVYVSENLD